MRGRPNLLDAYYKQLSEIGDYIELPKKFTTSQICSSSYQFKRNRKRNPHGIDVSVQRLNNGKYIAKMIGYVDPTFIKNTDYFTIDRSQFNSIGKLDSNDVSSFGTVIFNFNPDYNILFELKAENGLFIFKNIRAINHYEELLDHHMVIDDELKEKIIHKLFAE